MDVSEVLRANLLQIMKDRNLSGASVSRKAGLNLRAVKDIEQGRSKSPKIETAFKIAQALDVPLEVLLGLRKCPCSEIQNFNEVIKDISQLSVKQRQLLITIIQQLVEYTKQK